MDWLFSADLGLARAILQRGVALMYVVAFVAAWRQFPALLGERGLLPVPRFLQREGQRAGPSLFRWRYCDQLLRVVAWAGIAIAVSVVVGLAQAGPWWVPLIAFGLMYLLYLSIVNVGQIFYGFGWESLLLEAGFLAAFLGSDQTGTPIVTIVAIKWLVFRVEFGAGLIKIRGDSSWRDLTALHYHHQTQPMPGPLSWFFHHLPGRLHQVEVAANHVVQLVVPFLLFAPQPVATWAAAAVVLTQLWLLASGNFAWLNWLTMILACAAVSGSVLTGAVQEPAETPVGLFVAACAMGALVLVLSWRPLLNLLSRSQRMNAAYNRWHLVGSYGAFGSVTKSRQEVIIEGTQDEDPSRAQWHAYEIPGKPGAVHVWPRQVAPYHLRLGWGMWFLALGSRIQLAWFRPLLSRLLEADPAMLRLFSHDPFDGVPPAWVRARVFDYRYSTWRELRSQHVWWVREEAWTLVDPIRAASRR